MEWGAAESARWVSCVFSVYASTLWKTTYVCEMPVEPMTLVIQDDRGSADRAVFAGIGAVLIATIRTNGAINAGIAAVLAAKGTAPRKFVRRMTCTFNITGGIAWRTESSRRSSGRGQVKEKYQLSPFLKGGI